MPGSHDDDCYRMIRSRVLRNKSRRSSASLSPPENRVTMASKGNVRILSSHAYFVNGEHGHENLANIRRHTVSSVVAKSPMQLGTIG